MAFPGKKSKRDKLLMKGKGAFARMVAKKKKRKK
jgi:hypothetical protein